MSDSKSQVSKAATSNSDEDLDKIMKEISSLEEQVETASVATTTPVTTAELSAEPATPVVTKTAPAAQVAAVKSVVSEVNNVHKFESKREVTQSPGSDSEQSLSMQLTGNLKLKLSFASGGRGIEISCGDDAFVCKLADGTEFKIPTTGVAKRKSA